LQLFLQSGGIYSPTLIIVVGSGYIRGGFRRVGFRGVMGWAFVVLVVALVSA